MVEARGLRAGAVVLLAPAGFCGLLLGGLLVWGYPAMALGVSGLLLIAAVTAQAVGATAWLPIVRRGLAGVGVRRRRPDSSRTSRR